MVRGDEGGDREVPALREVPRRDATCYVRYGSAHWMLESPDLDRYPFTPPPGWGYSLPVIYLAWAFVVVAMYPFCQWFARLKQRRSDAWLSHL
jgi:hypothetical protein